MCSRPGCYKCKYRDLHACSPLDVQFLELVKSSQHTSTGNTSENVGTGSFHHGHEPFSLHNLDSTVNGALVLDSTTRGHHHTSSDGVNGIGHEASGDSYSPAKKEGGKDISVLANQDRLEGVKQAEVHATVDEDSNSRDDKASVEPHDTIGLQGLDINIDETIELSFTTLALGIVGQSGPAVVKGVDEEKRHGSCSSSRGNVRCELPLLRGILRGGEDGLDAVLEGEVERLGGEVSDDIGQVATPQGVDSFRCENPLETVDDSIVRPVQTSLLDHLILVLDEQLDALNWSSSSLGDSSSHTSQHEVLHKAKLL